MAKKSFWRGLSVGVALGAGAGLGTVLLIDRISRPRRHVVRLEKSLQIGLPVPEVFDAWLHLERLPDISDSISEVRVDGRRSYWSIVLGGRQFEWEAEIEQFIPLQSIAWKSLSGPKHTGRISFAPVGNDTLVHVTMNYAPPSRLLRPFASVTEEHLEEFISKVLRDFKASLEGKGQSGDDAPIRMPDAGATPMRPAPRPAEGGSPAPEQNSA